MGSDRQDFLERREARLRRMQQRLAQEEAASRLEQLGGRSASKKRQPPVQSSGARKGRSGQITLGKAVSSGSGSGQSEAKQAGGHQAARKSAVQTPEQVGAAAGKTGQPPIGGRLGRRMAALRGQFTPAGTAGGGPKPSLLVRTIVWGTGAICVLLILATLGEAWTVHRLNQQVAASQQQVNWLQAQNRAITSNIHQLQKPETIEQEARRLGYIYPGDQPVVVVTTQPTPTPSKSAPSSSQDWWGFWPDWLKFFFGGG